MPSADKSGQEGRIGRILLYFCGRPLWMTPQPLDNLGGRSKALTSIIQH